MPKNEEVIGGNPRWREKNQELSLMRWEQGIIELGMILNELGTSIKQWNGQPGDHSERPVSLERSRKDHYAMQNVLVATKAHYEEQKKAVRVWVQYANILPYKWR